ncbi:hypothetical protein ANCCAN_09003 [Ancylostoma caninum]|uniref:Uncharacterized protein n=1 Tax=Ancylostoma caninum TaxID=29170 RepID=A0A368GN09_ANCCA|nr:hypothetical protein ANCCAN_09003 [Ancylostoma caninum]
MLRWIAGITRVEHIRNKKIRESFVIAPIRAELDGTATFCAPIKTHVQVGLDLEVPEIREIGIHCWPKGWPTVAIPLHADLKQVGVQPDQAHDRAKSRQKIRKAGTVNERDER